MDRLSHPQLIALIASTLTGNLVMGDHKTLEDKIAKSLRCVMEYNTVDDLDKGTATSMNMIPTVNMDVGTKITITVDGIKRNYELYSGTYATAIPFFIRGSDYAADTNEKVWVCIDNEITVKSEFSAAQIKTLKTPSKLTNTPGAGFSVHITHFTAFLDHGKTNFIGEEGKDIELKYEEEAEVLGSLNEAFIEASADLKESVSTLGREIFYNKKIMISYNGVGEIRDGDGTLTIFAYCKLEI